MIQCSEVMEVLSPLERFVDLSCVSPVVLCSCDEVGVLEQDRFPVFSDSWVCVLSCLRFLRYGAVYLYTVSYVRMWENED